MQAPRVDEELPEQDALTGSVGPDDRHEGRQRYTEPMLIEGRKPAGKSLLRARVWYVVAPALTVEDSARVRTSAPRASFASP